MLVCGFFLIIFLVAFDKLFINEFSSVGFHYFVNIFMRNLVFGHKINSIIGLATNLVKLVIKKKKKIGETERQLFEFVVDIQIIEFHYFIQI